MVRNSKMSGNLHFVFKGPKYLIPLALKFRMPLLLLCLLLNYGHFSWYKHPLLLLILVCSFSLLSLFSRYFALFYLTLSFLFLHLYVQPYLFLSYVIIVVFVVEKLYVFR